MDKQEVIDQIEAMAAEEAAIAGSLPEAEKYKEIRKYHKERSRVLDAAVDLINEANPGWIHVGDWLPRNDKPVLVLTQKGFVHRACYYREFGDWMIADDPFDHSISSVTHWMPCPKLPK